MKTNLNHDNPIFQELIPGLEEVELDSTNELIAMEVKGLAGSPGTALGRALVVSKKDDLLQFRTGDVLVSRKAVGDLGIVLPMACALVTEYGGLGAAILNIAREYGVPAVVGVTHLTEIVQNGDLLFIDGKNGIVKIINLNDAKAEGAADPRGQGRSPVPGGILRALDNPAKGGRVS
jgi:pyruvate, water dikinase